MSLIKIPIAKNFVETDINKFIRGNTKLVILGIDPGYAITGYGIIECKFGIYKPMVSGAILTDSRLNFSERLEIIFDEITKIVSVHKPDVASIEKLYFNNNQKTAIAVAHARGVITLALKKSNVPIYEYTPLQVKSVITGYGRASKTQVIMMTKMLLKSSSNIKLDDTADALALAICHASMSKTSSNESLF